MRLQLDRYTPKIFLKQNSARASLAAIFFETYFSKLYLNGLSAIWKPF